MKLTRPSKLRTRARSQIERAEPVLKSRSVWRQFAVFLSLSSFSRIAQQVTGRAHKPGLPTLLCAEVKPHISQEKVKLWLHEMG